MKQFKDFNIKPEVTAFTGDKIKIDKVLNIPIVVLNYKIEPSKHRAGTNLLTLHIERNGTKHVIFTGAKVLQQMIESVPRDCFPFETIIIREDEHYEFT